VKGCDRCDRGEGRDEKRCEADGERPSLNEYSGPRRRKLTRGGDNLAQF